ncbi:MAG: aminoacyl-tRNA hydrolase [Pirellulaceae bacterium]
MSAADEEMHGKVVGDAMKVIVGLGNPGAKYAETRHNIGFRVLGELAGRLVGSAPREKFHGELVEARINGEVCCLLSPLTYMNHSGLSVLEVRDFYKLAHADLLICCDDFNLPLGKLRVRTKGSAGGQKGLADIIRRLGADDVPRLRIGIGPVPDQWDPAGFVLGRFTADEAELVQQMVRQAADAVEVWVRDGIENCMNRFNAGPA